MLSQTPTPQNSPRYPVSLSPCAPETKDRRTQILTFQVSTEDKEEGQGLFV